MTIHQFLALFPYAKETKKGWDVCCPAHDDKHPSLGVMEGDGGRIVLNCLAHCGTGTICDRLGLTMSDLFPDTPLHGRVTVTKLPPIKTSPRKLAFAFELHALDLRQHAEKILSVAKACGGCETWTNDDFAVAMKAVGRAYVDLDRARFCESYADHLREKEYELKRTASH